MIKFIFLLILPFTLIANLNYAFNHNKEIQLLDAFDIEASFLFDPTVNKLRNSNKAIYKNKHFFRAMDQAFIYIPTIKNN